MQTSRVAMIARGVALLAAALFVLAPLSIQLGLLSPGIGFRGFMLGGLLGVVGLLLGLVGLFLTRPAAGGGGRSAAVMACGIGAVILAVILATAGPTANVPPINDITTDLANPPAFQRVLTLEGNQGRDMAYPAEFVPQQTDGYPDLEPLAIRESPAVVLDRIEAAVKELGWELVGRDDAQRIIEASETSAIFRFVDDVVVRVTPASGGSLVDVRSKSRVGRSDLGANAARIEALLAKLGK